MSQEWPGNVRQLENTLERLINLIDSTEINLQHILHWTDMRDAKENIDHKAEGKYILQFQIVDNQWPPLKDIVAEVEKEVIMRVLEKFPSSRLAGQVLGVSNTTILNKIKKTDKNSFQ